MKVNALSQCCNCNNYRFKILGILFYKTEGRRKIKSLRKQEHCAAQDQKQLKEYYFR
jgi:hypothetical protein